MQVSTNRNTPAFPGRPREWMSCFRMAYAELAPH
jgi:hypothetical protein